MKNLLTFILFIFITGCSNHSSNIETVSTKAPNEPIYILPEDAFPFQFDGQHIRIQAIMNDSVAVLLLFDTGAQRPIFDSSFIAENKDQLNLKTESASGSINSPSGLFKTTQRITGTIKLNVFAENKDFQGALMIADLEKMNLGADALMPASLFFKNKIVLMDLKHHYFRILSQDTLDNLKEHFVSLPLKGNIYSYFTVPSKISIDKSVNNSVNLNGELIIDIGAPGLLYLFNTIQSGTSTFPSSFKTHEIIGLSFNGNDTIRKEAIIASRLRLFDTLSIQDAKITLLNHKIAPNSNQIGLLGNEFLQKFIVIIDYKNKQFYLQPGSEYYAPCNISNLGMTLRKESSGKSFIVSAIDKQSPISISSIQLGDQILAINGVLSEDISVKYMDSIKFSPIGTKLNLRIQRNQKVFNQLVTIQNIW